MTARSEVKPDVVLVLLDSLRADAVDRRVEGAAVMPRLASWSRVQTSFRGAVATSPSTPSSVSALMSSVPHTAYDGGFDRGTSPSIPVLPELLREAGYRTLGISANHNCSVDLMHDRGFDEFAEAFSDPKLASGPLVREDYPARVVPPEALFDWARQRLDAASDSPVFAYLHVFQPHAPYDPPAEHLDVFARRDAGPDAPPTELAELARLNRTGRFPARWASPLRSRYDAHCSYVDGELGRFIDWISAHPRYRDAAVVVTSDHGEAFFEHRQILHNTTLFEEMIRIPLVVRPPGGAPPRQVDDPVSLLDVAPTILSWAGIEPPSTFFGDDLFGGLPARRSVFSSTVDSFGLHSIRRGKMKLIQATGRAGGSVMLYELTGDPGETNDLASSRQVAADVLREILDQRLADLSRMRLEPAPAISFSKKRLEILESLGYAGAASR